MSFMRMASGSLLTESRKMLGSDLGSMGFAFASTPTRRIDIKRALDRDLMPAMGLAYNTREKHQVEEVLELAKNAGGTIEKEPEETFWGGYSGYFADPDGHLWEVAWAASWEFNADGSLVL